MVNFITNKLKIEYIDIKDIKPNSYNPKQMTEKEAKDLEKSIVEFGIVDPLIVNKAKGREGIIIGGHQRYKIYQKLGYKQVPVIWLNIPDLKKEQELCLRLSKNTGSWDYDLLANFEEDLLLDVGWEEDEILEIFSLDEIEDYEIDFERLQVLMVNPPGGVKLKERVLIQFEDKDDYEKVKKFLEKKENKKFLKQKILEFI